MTLDKGAAFAEALDKMFDFNWEVHGWRPIHEAPKNGTEILLAILTPDGYWMAEKGRYYSEDSAMEGWFVFNRLVKEDVDAILWWQYLPQVPRG